MRVLSSPSLCPPQDIPIPVLSDLCEAMKTNTYVRSFSLVATKSGDPIANVRLADIPSPLPISWHAPPGKGCLKGHIWRGCYPHHVFLWQTSKSPYPYSWLTTLQARGHSPQPPLSFSNALHPTGNLLSSSSNFLLLPFCLSTVTCGTGPFP